MDRHPRALYLSGLYPVSRVFCQYSRPNASMAPRRKRSAAAAGLDTENAGPPHKRIDIEDGIDNRNHQRISMGGKRSPVFVTNNDCTCKPRKLISPMKGQRQYVASYLGGDTWKHVMTFTQEQVKTYKHWFHQDLYGSSSHSTEIIVLLTSGSRPAPLPAC